MLYLLLQHGSEAAEAASDGAAEAASGQSEAISTHLTNWVAAIANYLENTGNEHAGELLEQFENVIFSWIIMAIIAIFFIVIARNLHKIPGRAQNFAEYLFSTLDNFVKDVLGPSGRTYVPLVGSLFIYILCMNLGGIIPFGHSPSSSLNITLSLAICVFLTVQIHGIRGLGLWGWVKHYLGLSHKPHIVEIILSPLMIVLHTIGELAKPVSLSLRLFGNITGEDVLLAVFVGLIAYLTKTMAGHEIFFPLQLMVYPIVLLGSFIQALVFSLLTTVYILLMSPHEEEH